MLEGKYIWLWARNIIEGLERADLKWPGDLVIQEIFNHSKKARKKSKKKLKSTAEFPTENRPTTVLTSEVVQSVQSLQTELRLAELYYLI